MFRTSRDLRSNNQIKSGGATFKLERSAPFYDLSNFELKTELFIQRHRDKAKGVPPELRKDRDIRDFIKTLTPFERKDWSDKELVHIVRGTIHALLSSGIKPEELEKVTRFALQATIRATLWNRFRMPAICAWHFLKQSPFPYPLLTPIIAPLLLAVGVMEAADGILDKIRPKNSRLVAEARGYWGSPVGAFIKVAKDRPLADLGMVMAHEVSHIVQDLRDPHPEYMSYTNQSSYVDGIGGEVNFNPAFQARIKKKEEYSSYSGAIVHSFAASNIITTAFQFVKGQKVYEIAESLRFLKSMPDITLVYKTGVSPIIKAKKQAKIDPTREY